MRNADAHGHGPDRGCESRGDPRSMGFLDRYLSVWIVGAMAIGVGRGSSLPR